MEAKALDRLISSTSSHIRKFYNMVKHINLIRTYGHELFFLHSQTLIGESMEGWRRSGRVKIFGMDELPMMKAPNNAFEITQPVSTVDFQFTLLR